MADLTWLPYTVAEWETRVRELGLTLADEGALMRLLRGAWPAAEPCTITDSPDELARIVGAEWKKAVPLFRRQFAPLPDHPSRRRCGWLYDLYLKQLDKHQSYKDRGGEGARRKAELKAQREAERTGQLEAQLGAELKPNSQVSRAESSAEALSCAPTEHTAKSPASGEALAPVGAARAAATSEGLAEFGDTWRAVMQGQPTAPAPGALETRQASDRERRYFALLAHEADAWMALHRDDAKAIEREQRQLLELPATGDLLLADKRGLRDAMLEEIRARLGWPTTEEWDESDALTTLTGATP